MSSFKFNQTKVAFSVRIFLLWMLVFSLGACSSLSRQPSATLAKVELVVEAGVNPDTRGRPSPIVIRLYELTATNAFEAADFFSLYDQDRQLLGAELVAVEELQLMPGEKRVFERTLQTNTQHLAVVAAFRQIEKARWRSNVAVQPNRVNNLLIKVDSTSILMEAAR